MAMLTVADVQSFMGSAQGDLGNVPLVQLYIDAVVPVIESLSQPLTLDTRVRVMTGNGQRALAMPWPFTSVMSIIENGVALAATDYYTEGSSGLIYRGAIVGTFSTSPASTFLNYWPYGMDNIVVTVAIGAAIAPGNVKLAALELFKHLWATRGGSRPAFGGRTSDDTPYVPSGFAVPHKVTELLLATPQMPGFA